VWSRRVLRVGLALFPVLAVLLWWGTPLGWGEAAYLVFLVELLPVLAVAQLAFVRDGELPRLPVYGTSAGSIVLLAGLAFALGRGWEGDAMGLGWPGAAAVAAWGAGLTVAALLLVGGLHLFRRRLGIREAPILKALLPRTGRERGGFALLSLAAGVGEEVTYRGYALAGLATVTGSWALAVVVSSAAFGALHAYQGAYGVVRTALLGALLAWSVTLTGSLWPAAMAHVAVDLVVGLVLAERLVQD